MGFVDDIKAQFNKPNNLVWQVIILNIVIWVPFTVWAVLSQLMGDSVIFPFVYENVSLSSIPTDVMFKPWTLLSYGFFHSPSQIFHIIINMFILYGFGRILADYYGQEKFLSVYILGILGGGVIYLLAYNFIPFYVEREGPANLVGASAGVTAVLVALATFMPDFRVNLMLFGSVKMAYIAMFFVALSFIGTVGSNAGGDMSHLGGALLGYIYAKLHQGGTDIGKWIITIFNFFKNLFKAKPKVKVSYKSKSNSRSSFTKSSNTATGGSFTTQSEIDVILDKISQSGYESLTKEEKQKLFSASQKN